MEEQSFWTVLVSRKEDDPRGRSVAADLRALGFPGGEVRVSDLYWIAPPPAGGLERAAPALCAEPVTQSLRSLSPGERDAPEDGEAAAGQVFSHRATVKKRPGVMDPVEASAVQALADLGVTGAQVRTASRFHFSD